MRNTAFYSYKYILHVPIGLYPFCLLRRAHGVSDIGLLRSSLIPGAFASIRLITSAGSSPAEYLRLSCADGRRHVWIAHPYALLY
jgi:hypothetical protein